MGEKRKTEHTEDMNSFMDFFNDNLKKQKAN